MAKKNKKNNKNKQKNNSMFKEVKVEPKEVGKGTVGLLIGEVIIAVSMVMMIISKTSIPDSFEIGWAIYLVAQVILGFTVFSHKKNKNISIGHWETTFITLAYVILTKVYI